MPEKQQLETGNATTALVRWADADPTRRRLRYLAALALRESGWTLEAIGQAFGHPRGHVTRMLRRCRELVQADFSPPAEFEE